jgi:ATP-dependent exoDNAse (exonuclease V) beta subunit
MSWRTDVTRGYVDALEARGVPHLLVGGRSFHEREEVETLRSALAAIEWPDDQLSVYATLRGGLFGVGEELLLAYWHQHPRRRFHPFDIPEIEAPTLEPVVTVLRCLRELHIRRNHRPVADTIAELLNVTRAHVGFVLRPAGEQALANVMHVAELARQYEMDGGISFRGFVEELRLAAERLESPEAPVLEEGSEGVRLMTVHKAKGLEFPVVVLADITCRLNRATAGRVLEAPSGLCAIRLAGCAPAELLEHQADEVARDEAEGVRLAYVAATRARDLLIVPAVGDQEVDGWVRPLNAAIYPATGARRRPQQAPGCPEFFKDTVLERPDGDPHGDWTVAPGLHEFVSSDVPLPLADSHLPVRDVADMYSVVWWDPKALTLDVQPPGGLRAADLIARAGSEQLDADALRSYWTWQGERGAALAAGSAPTMRVRTITEWAQSGDPWPSATLMPHTEIVELPRAGTRPSGRRFGTLVHAVLATAALHTDRQTLLAVARVQGRLFGAVDEEIAAAGDLASQVLEHPLLRRAREADHRGACRREVPVTLTASGTLMEGIVDLAFEEDGRWVVVDFKTDGDLETALDAYRRQVSMYAAAFSQAMHRPVDAHILTI